MNKQLNIECIFLNLEILEESDNDSWEDLEILDGEKCPQGHCEVIKDQYSVFKNVNIEDAFSKKLENCRSEQ